jgi:hypothetical protein
MLNRPEKSESRTFSSDAEPMRQVAAHQMLQNLANLLFPASCRSSVFHRDRKIVIQEVS